MKTGVVVFAHGSSVASANEAVRQITRSAASAGGLELIETAFLELTEPDLGAAVRRLVEQGAGRILVIPYFLTLGFHLQQDLPSLVEELSRIHPGVEIRVAPPLDGHPALSGILLDRVREALTE